MNNEDNWIKHEDQEPQVDQQVIYFFKYVGVHRGYYRGDHLYTGKSGFLIGDVTHWMPDEGQELPERPQGKEWSDD